MLNGNQQGHLFWPHGQVEKTPPFQGGIPSSILGGVIYQIEERGIENVKYNYKRHYEGNERKGQPQEVNIANCQR